MKKNKVYLLILGFLFLAFLGTSLGFSLYTVGEVNVEVKEASITNIAKNSYDSWYADVEIDVDSTHDAKFYCRISIFYEESGVQRVMETEELEAKQGKCAFKMNDIYLNYYATEANIEDFRIETEIYSIKKLTTTLNYIGYCLFPLSLLIGGFVIYALFDFIKEKRSEKG